MTNIWFWMGRECKCLKKAEQACYAGDLKKYNRYKKLARRARKKHYFMYYDELMTEHKTRR